MEENSFLSKEAQQLLAEEIYKEYLSFRAGEPVVLIGTPIGVVDAIRLAALRRVLLLFNTSEQSIAMLRDVPGAKRCTAYPFTPCRDQPARCFCFQSF